jgi:hypothetical protein
MKLTTKIFLTITFLFIFGEVFSQSCEAFYPMSKGGILESQNFNAKNKLTGSNRQTILDVTTGVNSSLIKVNSQTFDPKGKELGSQDLVMRCENGIFMMDMKNFLDPKAMGGGEMEVKIDAKDMEYPQNLSPGMTLKDASIRMTILSNGMTIMTMETRIFNRKVEGIENVTTPAGTFECYKISYESEVKAVVKVKVKGVQYISKGVGVVRSESYDKNGKLTDYNIISKISGI